MFSDVFSVTIDRWYRLFSLHFQDLSDPFISIPIQHLDHLYSFKFIITSCSWFMAWPTASREIVGHAKPTIVWQCHAHVGASCNQRWQSSYHREAVGDRRCPATFHVYIVCQLTDWYYLKCILKALAWEAQIYSITYTCIHDTSSIISFKRTCAFSPFQTTWVKWPVPFCLSPPGRNQNPEVKISLDQKQKILLLKNVSGTTLATMHEYSGHFWADPLNPTRHRLSKSKSSANKIRCIIYILHIISTSLRD